MPSAGLQMFGAGLQLQQVTPGTANIGNANISGTFIAASMDTRNAPTVGSENSYFGSGRIYGTTASQQTAAFGYFQTLGGAGNSTPQFATLMGVAANVYSTGGTAVGQSATAGAPYGVINQNQQHTAVGRSSAAFTANPGTLVGTHFDNSAFGYSCSAVGLRITALGANILSGGVTLTDCVFIGGQITPRAGQQNTICIRMKDAAVVLTATDDNSIIIGDATQPRVLIGPYTIGQSVGTTVKVADANYAIKSTDGIVMMTSISAPRTWTLPAANSVPAGYIIRLIDMSGSVTGVNNITISPSGADTINGPGTPAINTAYGANRLMSDGVSKWVDNNQF